MKKTILFFSILLASCAGKQTQEIRTMERLSTKERNMIKLRKDARDPDNGTFVHCIS